MWGKLGRGGKESAMRAGIQPRSLGCRVTVEVVTTDARQEQIPRVLDKLASQRCMNWRTGCVTVNEG